MVKRFAVLFAAAAFAAPAHAQNATVDPDHVMALLKEAGYPTEVFGEDATFRQILSKSGNYEFLIEMYDCKGGKACETLEFFSGFPMENPPTKEALEGYSGPREGARIYIDRRGDPSIQLPVEFGADDLTDAQFLDKLKNWETMLTSFAGFLKDKPAAPAET